MRKWGKLKIVSAFILFWIAFPFLYRGGVGQIRGPVWTGIILMAIAVLLLIFPS